MNLHQHLIMLLIYLILVKFLLSYKWIKFIGNFKKFKPTKSQPIYNYRKGSFQVQQMSDYFGTIFVLLLGI